MAHLPGGVGTPRAFAQRLVSVDGCQCRVYHFNRFIGYRLWDVDTREGLGCARVPVFTIQAKQLDTNSLVCGFYHLYDVDADRKLSHFLV